MTTTMTTTMTAVADHFILTAKPVIASELAAAAGVSASTARKWLKECEAHPDFVIQDRDITVHSRNYPSMDLGTRRVQGVALTERALCRMIRELRSR